MPGTSSHIPRRRGAQKTPEKAKGLSPAKFYSPKTPGWVSGSQMKFEENSPVNNFRKGRKSVIPKGTALQKPTTNSRRHTLFKLPDPVRSSPIGTRSRRSSIFNVESRKGGIRLTIAVTPQEKPKKGQGKAMSPPGVTTRTRRSSMYQKGKSLQEACSKPERVSLTGQKKPVAEAQNKAENAVPKKAAVTRRSVCPKSPSPTSSKTSRITDTQLTKGSAAKRNSVQPNTAKSETEDTSSPVCKKARKTPRPSVSKSAAENSDLKECVEDPQFKTPARPVSSVSEDTQSVSTRRLRSARKTPQVSQSLNAVELNTCTPKNETNSKTPKSKRKTPAQSASKKLRSATKSKSQTPAVSRSTRKRKMDLPEDIVENDTQQTETKMKKEDKTEVTLSPEMTKTPRDESPKFTDVKQKIDLSAEAETPQVKKVRMTPAALSKTSESKSRQSYRKTPAKAKGSDADSVSLDESVEFKTPMKTPAGVKKSTKKTTITPACKTPQVMLTKLDFNSEETKMESVQEGNVQKTVQVLSPVLDSPVEHSGKLSERKSTPARVQPDSLKTETLGKGKSKKEGKGKKLKTKGKENSTVSLNGTLNTTSHSSTGARCTIL